MVKDLVINIAGGLLVVAVIELYLRVALPKIRTALMMNVDLRGIWLAQWEWDCDSGQVRDEIRIMGQSGNDVWGTRVFYDTPSRSYRLRGFYKDGLLVGHYWSDEFAKRYAGAFIFRLSDDGDTLTGKVIYPEKGNLSTFVTSNLNSFHRERV